MKGVFFFFVFFYYECRLTIEVISHLVRFFLIQRLIRFLHLFRRILSSRNGHHQHQNFFSFVLFDLEVKEKKSFLLLRLTTIELPTIFIDSSNSNHLNNISILIDDKMRKIFVLISDEYFRLCCLAMTINTRLISLQLTFHLNSSSWAS